MPRPKRCRRICGEPEYIRFSPDGFAANAIVNMSLDEYEAVRLVDLEQQTHEQAARQMAVSRTTVTEIYESARKKIADSIVNGKQMVISGGNYVVCGTASAERCKSQCENKLVIKKGKGIMRIAVTYENGEIFQHFGHSEAFKIYDVKDKKIVSSEIVRTNGNGHGALAGMLKELNTDVLICGGIGGGAQTALNNVGIKLFGGVCGDADKAVEALLKGELSYNPSVTCRHHAEHHCGEEHHCGNHS